jgi:hypothetical protein
MRKEAWLGISSNTVKRKSKEDQGKGTSKDEGLRV